MGAHPTIKLTAIELLKSSRNPAIEVLVTKEVLSTSGGVRLPHATYPNNRDSWSRQRYVLRREETVSSACLSPAVETRRQKPPSVVTRTMYRWGFCEFKYSSYPFVELIQMSVFPPLWAVGWYLRDRPPRSANLPGGWLQDKTPAEREHIFGMYCRATARWGRKCKFIFLVFCAIAVNITGVSMIIWKFSNSRPQPLDGGSTLT